MNKKNKYNKYENIEIKSFYDTDDVSDLIFEKVEELGEDNDLVVYAKRDLISELFVNMIENDYDFGYIDFDNLDDLLKNEVYIMTVSYDRRVNIEHAYRDGRIVQHESKIALFYTDDCKQDIIDYCINNNMEVILFDFEDDDGYCGGDGDRSCNCGCNDSFNCERCDGCKNCKECGNTYESESTTVTVSKSKNGTLNGFTKSWDNNDGSMFSSTTYSFYSDDLGLLGEVAKDFGVKL